MAYVDDRLYVNHLYGIFLNEYYKLNKTLELENPIQIYALFHKLVYSGYLSKGKVFNTNISDISDDDRLKYELILGFRKLKGINKFDFKNKFNKNIYEVEGIKELLDNGMLSEDEEYIFIPDEWIYKSNEILIKFV